MTRTKFLKGSEQRDPGGFRMRYIIWFIHQWIFPKFVINYIGPRRFTHNNLLPFIYQANITEFQSMTGIEPETP